MKKTPRTFNSKSSTPLLECQICENPKLKSIMFLGYMRPVSTMRNIEDKPIEETFYPTEFVYCPTCHLAQIAHVVDPKILFLPEYVYTSSTTKVLRDNFAELYRECSSIIDLKSSDLIVDIGSNDGNLLMNFKDNHKVLGVTPEEIGKFAIKKGIPTMIDFFNEKTADKINKKYGKAKVVTATNVFAHIEKVHDVVTSIKKLLEPSGVFISESHYLLPLLRDLQYDTIYHEHLRYYSLHSLSYLLNMHGLEIFHAKEIPTHGGSIRVYAAKKGQYAVRKSVKKVLDKEKNTVTNIEAFNKFKKDVMLSKLNLYSLLYPIKKKGKKIFGISAPARSTTLISYTGLDEEILDCVIEVEGSQKINKYIPGTKIPVLSESKLMSAQPEYALLLSWHIAGELIPKLKKKGFRGDFIVPLPKPYIIKNKQVKVS